MLILRPRKNAPARPPLEFPTVTAWEAWHEYCEGEESARTRKIARQVWQRRAQTATKVAAALRNDRKLVLVAQHGHLQSHGVKQLRVLTPADVQKWTAEDEHFVGALLRISSWLLLDSVRRKIMEPLATLIEEVTEPLGEPLAWAVTTPADWTFLPYSLFCGIAERYYAKVCGLKGKKLP